MRPRPAAEQLITAVSAVNDACTAHDFMDGDRFTALLSDIADSNFAAPLLSGFCCAVLMERGLIAPGKLSELIGRRLSPGFAQRARSGSRDSRRRTAAH